MDADQFMQEVLEAREQPLKTIQEYSLRIYQEASLPRNRVCPCEGDYLGAYRAKWLFFPCEVFTAKSKLNFKPEMVPKPYPEGRKGRVCLGGGYIVSYAVQCLDGVAENSNKLSDLDCFKTS